MEEPTVTLPRLALEGVRVNFACVPVPLTATTALAPWVVKTVTLPETVSCALGLKVTIMVCVWPGVNVTGRATPLVAVSVAVTVIFETVTLVLPLLVRVTVCELELPALMLPKARLLGFADREVVLATPVPLKEIVAGEPGALLRMLTVPVRVPAVFGANTALSVAVAPAAKVVGAVRPFTL